MYSLSALFGFGVQELLLIFGLCLLMFGATRLPQLGKGLGEGIRNFKQGLKPGDDGKNQLDEGQEDEARP